MSATISILIFLGLLLGGHFLTRHSCPPLEPLNKPVDLQFTNTIKGLAMLMILYHHSGIYHSSELWFFFGSGWCFSGVSLFLFISGYGLVQSQKKNDYSIWAFIKKRWISIGPTIALCMVARWMLDPVMDIEVSFPLDPVVLMGAKEWYIVALFTWYLIFIVLVRNLAGFDCAFAMGMAALILWALLDIASTDFPMAGLWLRFPFSFVLGVGVGCHSRSVIGYLTHRPILCLSLSMTAVVLACHLKVNNNLVYPMLDLAILPLGLSAAILVYRLNMNSGLIQFLGKNSLPLYLIQVPMIKYGVFMGQWQNNILGLLMTWAVIFIVSALITRVRSLLDIGARQVYQVCQVGEND